MIPPEIAIISACIGAVAGLLAQYIANSLRDKTDKKKTIIECISEERRLAHLLFINAKGIEQTIIRIEYYFQLASIEDNSKSVEQTILRYHDELNFSGEISKEYSFFIGDYSKNIQKLMLYIGYSKELENLLNLIIDYKFDDALNIYEKYRKYSELYDVYYKDHDSIELKLRPYKKLFSDIDQKIRDNKKIRKIMPAYKSGFLPWQWLGRL